jgi:hypothetical protein
MAYWDTDRGIIRSVGGMAPRTTQPTLEAERQGQIFSSSTHGYGSITWAISIMILTTIIFWCLGRM